MSGGQAGQVDEVAAERVRRRYPRSRLPRPVLWGLAGALAVLGLTWVVWAGAFHSRPPVSAEVITFQVVSDNRVDVRLVVHRRDPSRPVTCRVIAQAADFAIVGEQDRYPVPPSAERVVTVSFSLTTVRRPFHVSARGCELA